MLAIGITLALVPVTRAELFLIELAAAALVRFPMAAMDLERDCDCDCDCDRLR